MNAIPPVPDPCLVVLRGPEGELHRSEKKWRKARACAYGCGRVCKREADPLFEESWGWSPGGKIGLFMEVEDGL
jgi:hypothetical protein